MKVLTRRAALLVAALVAAALALPGAAFAAEYSDAASINSALSSESSVDATLSGNITGTITVPSGKTLNLDLNGHNITASTGCAIVNKGTLTITGSGTVSTSASGSAAVANFPDATCELKGGTYESSLWYVIKNMGTMTITGDVTVQKPEGSTSTASLIDNGWVSSSDTVAGESVAARAGKANLTISSGDFNGTSGEKSCSVVKNDDYGTLTISGGTFDSSKNNNTTDAATILNWNVATISGGTFTGSYPISNGNCSDTADKGEITISGGTFTGTSSILGNNGGATAGKGSVTITGGDFTLSGANTIFGENYDADSTTTNAYNYTIRVSGGTFSAPVPDSCIDGNKVNLTSDGETFTLGSADDAVAKVDVNETWRKVGGADTDEVSATATIYFASEVAATTYTNAHSDVADKVVTLKYTLEFDSQGGSDVDSQTLKVTVADVQTGEVTAKPTDPTREGYTFAGWYTGTDYATEFEFGKELTEDTTVYAKWTQNADADTTTDTTTDTTGSGTAAGSGAAQVKSSSSSKKAIPQTGDASVAAQLAASAIAGGSALAAAVALRRRGR